MVLGAVGDLPGAATAAFTRGEVSVPNELLRSLAKATPLLLSGLAVAFALRAGLFNIGAEGQLLLGACAAAWVGYSWHGVPPIVHVLCGLGTGALAGAIWAGVAGVLKAWRGAHEVIVTIMMNYIAILFTHWLVNGPARDVTSLAPATPQVLPTARLWAVEGGPNFSAGFAIAVLAVPVVSFILGRTALGFEIRAIGASPDAARSAGIPVGRATVWAMAVSGALAGLAGSIEVLGVHRRFLDAFSPGYGFDSIAVALLGNLNPVGVLGSACLFGGLAAGATHMEAYAGTPRQIAGVIQAVVIMAVGIRFLHARRHSREP
jgi:simple sugar transport system permease protein